MGRILVSLIVPLAIAFAVIAVLVWAVRRSAPTGRKAAVDELRVRFARGEIDQSELPARMETLTRPPDDPRRPDGPSPTRRSHSPAGNRIAGGTDNHGTGTAGWARAAR